MTAAAQEGMLLMETLASAVSSGGAAAAATRVRTFRHRYPGRKIIRT